MDRIAVAARLTRPAGTRARLTILAVFVLFLASAPGVTRAQVCGGTSPCAVSGDITTDTTWVLAESPYQVTGSMNIIGTDGPDTVTTLTIEPGVQVVFQANYSLRVGSASTPGRLVADGDDAGLGGPATILFSSAAATPGSWGRIEYRAQADAASVLRNAIVEYGGSSFQGNVALEHALGTTITINDVESRFSGSYGFVVDADATLDGVNAHDNGLEGIRITRGPVLIDGCVAENNTGHGIVLTASTSVTGTVQNCTSVDSVFYSGNQPDVTWTGNTFTSWGDTAGGVPTSRLEAEVIGAFNTANTVTPAAGARTEIITSGTVESDATWTPDLGTYVPLGVLTVLGSDGGDGITTLTVAPGVEVRMAAASQIRIGGTTVAAPGAIIADGNDAGLGGPATITFTSDGGSPGDWQGLDLQQGARTSLFRNAIIENGGSSFTSNIILDHATGDTMTLDGVEVRFSAYNGIVQDGPAILAGVNVHDNGNLGIALTAGSTAISDCIADSNGAHGISVANQASITGTVQNCTSIDSVFYAGASSDLIWSGNSFTSWGDTAGGVPTSRLEPEVVGEFNTDNTVTAAGGARTELIAGTVATDGTWTTDLGTYVPLGVVTIQGTDGPDGITTVIMAPGLIVSFGANTKFNIGGTSVSVPGALIADGDDTGLGGPALISFTSDGGSPGDWQGLDFQPGARASTLSNVLVENGGSSFTTNITLDHGTGDTMTLDDVDVRFSAYRGVIQDGPATMSGLSVHDNVDAGLVLTKGSTFISTCLLEDNGGHALRVGANASITGTIQNCARIDSVFYEGNQSDLIWTGNTFVNWGDTAGGVPTSRLEPEVVGAFSTDNTVNAATGARTELITGDVTRDATWNTTLGDYVPFGTITVAGTDGGDGVTTVTLAPGTEFRAAANYYFDVASASVPGALIADGNDSGLGGPAPIVFTSDAGSPAPGDWYGIRFRTQAKTSILRNALVEYGGASFNYLVSMDHTSPELITLEDVEVRFSAYRGIISDADSIMAGVNVHDNADHGLVLSKGTTAVSDCIAVDNGQQDIRVENQTSLVGTVQNCSAIESVYYLGASSDLVWTGNTFNNWDDTGSGVLTSRLEPEVVGAFSTANTVNAVPGARTETVAGTIATDGTWTTDLGTYVPLGTITVAGTDGGDGVTTVTLAPGVELRFGGAFSFDIGTASVPGAIIADGNDTGLGGPAPIVFTSDAVSPAPGDWQGIRFLTQARTSLLRNALVEYGGASFYYLISIDHTSPEVVTLDDVEVRFGAYRGIISDADSVLTGINVHDNADYGLLLSRGSTAVSNCIAIDNGQHDIRVENQSSLVGTVQNCTAIESVFYVGASSDLTWTGNTFNNWGDTAGGVLTSRLEPEVVGAFNTANTVSAAAGARTETVTGTIVTDGTWTTDLGSYVPLGVITVAGTDGADSITTLTLAPGVELRGATNFALNIATASVPGALVADGNDVGLGGPTPIVFTSNAGTPAPGDWRGISLQAQAGPSLLRNALVEYGGSVFYYLIAIDHTSPVVVTLEDVEARFGAYRGLYVDADAVLTDINVHDNAGHGVQLFRGQATVSGCNVVDNGLDDFIIGNQGSLTGTVQNCTAIESVLYEGFSSDLTWTGNTFNNWGARTSRFDAQAAGTLSTGNTINKVSGAVVEIIGETVTTDAIWTPAPGPYVLTSSANITIDGTDGADNVTTLTLNPGTTLLFPAFGGITVGGTVNPGSLVAAGAPGAKVNLNTSNPLPAAGSWGGVSVRGTGIVNLTETQILNSTTALNVTGGTVNGLDTVLINRANTGLRFNSATFNSILQRITLKSCDVGVSVLTSSPTIRNSSLTGFTWAVQNNNPASSCVDATDNWWGSITGPSGAAPVSGCNTVTPAGGGSAITNGVLFDPFLDAPDDDGDGVDKDDGDGFNDPCTGGNTTDCDDNCPLVSNPSQADQDGDGVGDACDTNPVLRVSSEPLDLPDFPTVQEAVDEAFQSGTRIEILSGTGPYFESVLVAREQVFSFMGVENLAVDPVIVDGGVGPAFRLLSKIGRIPMRLENLTARGTQGVRSFVDVEMSDLIFDLITFEAVQMDAGDGVLLDSRVEAGIPVGANVLDGASIDIRRTTMLGLTDAGAVAGGDVHLENTLIADGTGDGVRMANTGTLDVLFSTIAGHAGTGIDNSQAGTVSGIDRSIVWDNSGDDLVGVACTVASWSDIGVPDCSGVNNSIAANPLLDVDEHLGAGSPCLDYGPDPATFGGSPATDLAGGPRLRDYDGDGAAVSDCGAYEEANPAPTVDEVLNVRWELDFRLIWDAVIDAVEYHIYRGDPSSLSYSNFGTCRDDLDGDRSDLMLDDLQEPAVGLAFYYLVTAENSGSVEGTLGFASTAERSNFTPCP